MEGDFDAAGYLKAAGMTLVGSGNKPGVVTVRDQGGVEGTLDLNEVLKSEGITKANIIVNTPESALETQSPVSLIDRAALSFGNAKGQIAYLKKKFEDAKIGADGDLVVKDKGVWHKTDSNWLGGGDGWSMAAELAKDGADMLGEIPLIVGQTAGATAGGVVGTAAGPAGTAAGGVAGAMVGGASGSSIKMAFGRIIGTYDATPDEVARDIAVDTLVSAAGEGVALGMKHAVVPAVKKMYQWAGGTPGVQNAVAQTVSKVTGASLDDAMFLTKNMDEVEPAINKTIERSLERAKTLGTTNTHDVVLDEAKSRTMGLMKAVVSDSQKHLSAQYEKRFGEVLSKVGDDFTDGGNFAKALQDTFADLWDNGLITQAEKGAKAGRVVAAADDIIEKKLGMVDGVARKNFQTNVARLGNTLDMLRQSAGIGMEGRAGAKTLQGKELAQEIFESIRSLRELQRNIPESHAETRGLIGDIVSKFSRQVRSALPQEAQQLASSADSFYAQHLQHVDRAAQAIRGGDTAIEALVNQRRGGDMATKNMIQALTSLKPGGKRLGHELQKSLAVETFMNTLPKGTLGGQTARGAVVTAGFTLGGLPGAVLTGAPMSPRLVAKGFNQAAVVNRTVKGLSAAAKRQMAANPHMFETMMSELLRNLKPEGQQ